MSSQQQKSEQLAFGYVKTAYDHLIPSALIKLIQTFYDECVYWSFKCEQLKQLHLMKCPTFKIAGIKFELYLQTDNRWFVMGFKVSNIPPDIKYFEFYQEINCETLHCVRKNVSKCLVRHQRYFDGIICEQYKAERLKRSINTFCRVNLTYIEYKNDFHKTVYHCPMGKLHKESKLKWNVNGLLLPKYHYKNYYGVPPEWHAVYSDNFGDNNWCVKFYPHRLTAGLYFMLLSFPPQVSKMDVKIIVDINGKTVENIDFVTREKHGRLVFFAHAQTNYVITATLEIINIYNIHHQIIEENKWSEFGIIIDSNTNQNGRKRKYEHEIDKEEFYMDDNIIGEPSKKRLKTNDNIYIVKDIKNWKFINGKCKFEVEWDGYDNKTWERIENVAGNDKWMKCVEN
eukprot:148874_1